MSTLAALLLTPALAQEPSGGDDPMPSAPPQEVPSPEDLEGGEPEGGEPGPEPPAEAAPAPQVPRTVDLSTDGSLGSALDAIGTASRTPGPSLEGWAPLSEGALRGRWGIRPELAVALLPGESTQWAVRSGATISHRWWPLGEAPVQLGGQTDLTAIFPIGGATGRRFVLSSQVGPWLGPVGLRLGPVVRSDRTEWRSAGLTLEDALLVGGRSTVSVALGPLRVAAGLELGVIAAGPRPPADPTTAALPLIGDETGYSAGLAWMGRPLTSNVQIVHRQTAIGPEVDVQLGVGIQL